MHVEVIKANAYWRLVMGILQDIKFLKDLQNFLAHTVFDVSILRITFAIIVILLSLVLRQFFVKFIIKFLKKLTGRSNNKLDDELVCAFEKPSCFLFLILGIWLASIILKLPDGARNFIDAAVRSMIIFSIFWTAYRASNTLSSFLQIVVQKTETRLDDIMLPFIRSGLKVIIVVLAVITILQEWRFDVGGILAGLGLGGLAFALAAKDTASNLFGSITIMLDKPFAIGDWIKTPHVEGTVEALGFRSTRIRTFAQALVTIPNSVMSNDPITNWSRRGKRRISFRLGITYKTSTAKMKECVNRIREMLENHPEVHPQTTFVYFEKFGDSALEIFLYFFTNTTNWQQFLEVQQDVNLKIMNILEEVGVSVAFPSRSIYIESTS